MKRILILATIVGGLVLCVRPMATQAQGWGYGYYGPRYRPYGYGWRPGPYYPYRPYVAPGVFIGGPRIGIGIGTAYPYPPPPVYPPPCAYPYPGY
jgi:hypothetical protein